MAGSNRLIDYRIVARFTLPGSLLRMKEKAGIDVGDGFADDLANALACAPPAAGIKPRVRDGNDPHFDLRPKCFLKQIPTSPRMGPFSDNIDFFGMKAVHVYPLFD